MKIFLIRTLCLLLFLEALGAAPDVIPLCPALRQAQRWRTIRREYFPKNWNTEVIANVTKPMLTVFKPSPELRNGTAVVICPGGGFLALQRLAYFFALL